MIEEWRDIEGYKGYYQVSNLGRIKSLKRTVRIRFGNRIIEEKILNPIVTKAGYLAVNFVIGHRKQKLVHRLLANEFIPKISGKNHINHKDFNKQNNTLSNLEWVSPYDNIQHSCDGGRNGRIVINIQTGIFYYSAVEALESLGYNVKCIHKKLMGKIKNNNTPLLYLCENT